LATGAPVLTIKRPGREGEHSPPFSADVKNACSYTSDPFSTNLWRCVGKKKDAEGHFYIYIYKM